MNDRPTGQRVVVIGGGVIGACCAWFLNESGFTVTIVERDQFGRGCSHGNCGYVSPSHVLPLTRPGVLQENLPALLRSHSPLRIRLRWSPSLWHWLWRFSRRCNDSDMMESAVGRHQLLQSSQSLYKQLIAAEEH